MRRCVILVTGYPPRPISNLGSAIRSEPGNPPRLREYTAKMEIAYALYRTPRDRKASVATSCGSHIECRLPASVAGGTRPESTAEPDAGSPSGSITIANHFGPEAGCGCGGHRAGNQHQAEL